MSTVDEIVKDIMSVAPAQVDPIAAARWLDNRYKELVTKAQFSNLRKIGELSIPGVIDTGTVTTTRGSTSVAGASTTFETEVGSGTQEHYYFRTSNAWYKIASITNETALVLASAFAETAVSAGTYQIVKRTHALASDARWTGKFVFPRLRLEVKKRSRDEFDLSYPGRPLVGPTPQIVCLDGVDSNGYLQVEVYPPPENSELLRYVYWSLPTSLTLSSTIPAQIDAYVLKEGALIDVYRKAKISQIELGNVEAAALYANEEQKQRTVWRSIVNDAIRTQRGSDDVTFILESFGGRRGSAEIRTAREQILNAWSH